MAPSSTRRKEPSWPVAALPSKSPEAPPEQKKRKTPPPHPPEVERPKRLFQRTWPPGDEIRILEAIAAHRRAHGGDLPTAVVLLAALDGRLERKVVDARDVNEKQRSLKRRYHRDAMKAAPPADEHERRLYFLSRDVWAGDYPPKPPVAQEKSVSGGSPLKPRTTEATKDSKDTTQAKSAGEPTKDESKPRTLAEMREQYPYLVDEAMVLVDPPILEELLPSIEDNEALALNKKIKKARKQLIKAITESARMKNMETPTIFLYQSTKVQPEKPRLEKKDGEDICAQGRLARVEREVEELRQLFIASQNQDIGCENAESGLRSVVAENQISCNMVQKKIKAANGLPHGKNKEVTSKYKYDGVLPTNVPRDNLELQIKPPFNTLHGRTRKIDAESQTQRNVAGKEVVLISVGRPRTPVGKAILEHSSQSTIVGGMELGTQCCKVFLREHFHLRRRLSGDEAEPVEEAHRWWRSGEAGCTPDLPGATLMARALHGH
ncbi:uncharacterized protein C2845_PM15G00300 [Panicum miliaceum]|uniref:Glabrous enhancer-binding protein-like DBD domain-containing protein n=1 Tax=Panicum miliaceum TaxID=4540 RepID=A0A3L6QB72_PANMI|nr:uncharacterized protein C2845_PM15G00300 [Panicum miliaceum]